MDVDDLEGEEDALALLLAGLDDDAWAAPTPAAGWTVRDEVAHLAEGEELAALAMSDPAAFGRHLSEVVADLDAALEAMATRAAEGTPGDVLARWETARAATIGALRDHPADERILWVSRPMSPRSFTTARLMETFAHGYDVRQAVGAPVPATARLRHVAHLGVATRGFSFANRGLSAPSDDVRVELNGPTGERWTWGSAEAADRVEGPALDFCLVVTQRRNVADTDLHVVGAGAAAWMDIAQCFAGPPTSPPPRARER
jgi:uncharacterized protein (TIGR03084 family)